MVVVPKSNGKVCICVDLTKLNESVCRENHPLPEIDALLGEIGQSKVFTKLDANLHPLAATATNTCASA